MLKRFAVSRASIHMEHRGKFLSRFYHVITFADLTRFQAPVSKEHLCLPQLTNSPRKLKIPGMEGIDCQCLTVAIPTSFLWVSHSKPCAA